ncbi:MAG: cytochrome c biogenesis protein [Selenomonas sp.]|uniref:cytochrome c biogenesis protein n=1 Tax=Selenomonas sp. TaxID=2053611 RepID=UPI0025D82E9B|nr:cytochrome c biogenesis protein CcsA [Selenomonas sp.]MCI6099548.1 cytochrome c biogenesis protein [Selenomonas sp.]MCI6232697.1 cytochrome c biogenesis protein [Selenomonas sp.]
MKHFTLIIILFTLLVLALVFFVVPPAEGLGNFVRIIFIHIPCAWIGVLAFLIAAVYAWRVLRGARNGAAAPAAVARADRLSARSAALGLAFTAVATVTGAIFSRLTWGAFWNWDPRQTTILCLLLIYAAYLALRSVTTDPERRARVSAVYALFSFLAVPFLVFVIPRFYFSLHPEPVLNAAGHVDMDPTMLLVLLLALADVTLIYAALLRKGATS